MPDYELRPLGSVRPAGGRVHPLMLMLQHAAYEVAITEKLINEGITTPMMRELNEKKAQVFYDLYEKIYMQLPQRDEYIEDVCRLAKAYEIRINGGSDIELHSQSILPGAGAFR